MRTKKNEPFIDKVTGGIKDGLGSVKDGVTQVPNIVTGIFDKFIEEIDKQVKNLPKKVYETTIKPVWLKIKEIAGWIKFMCSLLSCCCIFIVLYYMGIPQMVLQLLKQVFSQLSAARSMEGPDLTNLMPPGAGQQTDNSSTTADSPNVGSLGIFEMPNFNNNLKQQSSTTRT